jgi:DNA-binding CsgD family transcriptional regulator
MLVATGREHEILCLLAEGLTGSAIALFLSRETVRTHVRNAMTKLGATTRVQAVALIVQTGGV